MAFAGEVGKYANQRVTKKSAKVAAKTSRVAANAPSGTTGGGSASAKYLAMLNKVLAQAMKGIGQGSQIQYPDPINPDDYSKYITDPLKYAQAAADSKYAGTISELEAAIKQAPVDTQSHIKNIGDWYDQVLGTLGTSVAGDKAATDALVGSQGASGQGFAAALGGKADPGAASVMGDAGIAAGGLGAMGAAQGSFDDHMNTILHAAAAEAKTSEQNAGERLVQELSRQLRVANQEKGDLLTTAQADMNQQDLVNLLQMGGMSFDQAMAVANAKGDSQKSDLSNLMNLASLIQSGAMLPGQLTAQDLANQAARGQIDALGISNKADAQKLKWAYADHQLQVSAERLNQQYQQGQIDEQTYDTQMKKLQIQDYRKQMNAKTAATGQVPTIDTANGSDRLKIQQLALSGMVDDKGFLTMSPGKMRNYVSNLVYGQLGFRKSVASEKYINSIVSGFLRSHTKAIALYDKNHKTAYGRGIGLPPALGGKGVPKVAPKGPPGNPRDWVAQRGSSRYLLNKRTGQIYDKKTGRVIKARGPNSFNAP